MFNLSKVVPQGDADKMINLQFKKSCKGHQKSIRCNGTISKKKILSRGVHFTQKVSKNAQLLHHAALLLHFFVHFRYPYTYNKLCSKWTVADHSLNICMYVIVQKLGMMLFVETIAMLHD